jgi:4-amino-4-deoxy-L-arabinose transferase-like glycosyltransferase
MAPHKSAVLAGPLAVLLLWLACVLPSLDRTRLQDVDELTWARVAQAAALGGHWWPLELDGRALYEKPPLLLWAAGATAKLSARPYAAWPYRLWTCLGAGLALFCVALIGGLLGRPALGFAAALALALQGDFIFHARFFTFDTPFIACALASLGLALRAARGLKSRDWWMAGLALALAAAFKSWFVLALAPAFACALALTLPRGSRRGAALALALPPLAVLFLWVALYVRWDGWAFLSEEWSVNLAGRALGRVNEMDPQGHAAYYLKWAARTTPALLPWVLAVPLGMAPQVLQRESGQGAEGRMGAFARTWIWAFCLSWLLGLALVRAETINYPLPLEAGLCLAIGMELALGQSPGRRAAQACLLLASVLSALRLWDPFWSLASGAALGLLWMRAASEREARSMPASARTAWTARVPLAFVVGLSLGLACLLGWEAFGLVQRPLDPSRQVADLLLAHPARVPDEVLWVIGGSTQAIDFYSSYQVRWLQALPARRPAQASLVETRQGWIFYPALAPPSAGSAPGRPS